jgi:hypothetical protein
MSPGHSQERRGGSLSRGEDEKSLSASTLIDGGSVTARSVSRGRDSFHSSGRGGIGNIRPSPSRDAPRPADGPDDFSVTRGRETTPNHAVGIVYSTGRGGAGNMRSPSRQPETPAIQEEEEEIMRRYAESNVDAPRSSGRGGAGNISTSRSRSRGPSSGLLSTGRGGAGNIKVANPAEAHEKDEAERRQAAALSPSNGVYSTGRGGIANITNVNPTTGESNHNVPGATGSPAPAPVYSYGRGGRGNMIKRASVEA